MKNASYTKDRLEHHTKYGMAIMLIKSQLVFQVTRGNTRNNNHYNIGKINVISHYSNDKYYSII